MYGFNEEEEGGCRGVTGVAVNRIEDIRPKKVR